LTPPAAVNAQQGIGALEDSMDDALRARYAVLVDYYLGLPGRRVEAKVAEVVVDGFTHAVVFNASVCIEGGRLWSGDVDLTEEGAKLAALAEDAWQTIYILHGDDDWGTYDPAFLEGRAVYWINSTGGEGYSSALVLGPDGRMAFRPGRR
jgi:hypothetical protein